VPFVRHADADITLRQIASVRATEATCAIGSVSSEVREMWLSKSGTTARPRPLRFGTTPGRPGGVTVKGSGEWR
jgi:hypothetical protein